MKEVLIGVLLLPSILIAQKDTAKFISPVFPISVNKPNVQTQASSRQNFYVTVPNFERFLDTASTATINKYILETPDSILQSVQKESEAAQAQLISQSFTDENDKDGDGHRGTSASGPDCDDLNPYVRPGARETCRGYVLIPRSVKNGPILLINRYMNEDCNSCTITGDLGDGDEDGDGQISCRCSNYSYDSRMISGCPLQFAQVPYSTKPDGTIARYIIKGPDCDDRNPAIMRSSQQCLTDKLIKVCENGTWKIYSCVKCVAQPNGTGTVIQ